MKKNNVIKANFKRNQKPKPRNHARENLIQNVLLTTLVIMFTVMGILLLKSL